MEGIVLKKARPSLRERQEQRVDQGQVPRRAANHDTGGMFAKPNRDENIAMPMMDEIAALLDRGAQMRFRASLRLRAQGYPVDIERDFRRMERWINFRRAVGWQSGT